MGLCTRFHCLPSQLWEEDAYIIRLLTIEALGNKQEDEEEDEDG